MERQDPATGRPVTVVVPFGTVPDWRFGAEVERPDAGRAKRLISALGCEAARCAGEFRGTTFTSVYLAGGPTCLTLDQLYAILQLVYDNLTVSPEEQSLDVLAGTVDEGRAKVLKESGFDQLNVRLAEGQSPERELTILTEAGFESVGIELALGVEPGAWVRRLNRLVELKPARIHFHVTAEGRAHDALLPALQAARELLGGDWREYLLFHFCRPGHESRHLLSLWSDTVQLGLGPAGLTRPGQSCRRNPAKLRDYLAAAKSGRAAKPVADRPRLLSELVRLEGIVPERLNTEPGRVLTNSGLLAERNGRFFLTDAGALALDRVAGLLA
ncbi:MAG: hypothetical protein ABIK37_04630 [candidate division WOR-3 bacterium]